MGISQKGVDLIKHFEGLELTAYRDAVGVVTIGYGHTKTAKMGQRITLEQAEMLLVSDLILFNIGVERLVTAKLCHNQFDALVSFAFNLGLGNLGRSTLLKKVNADPNDPSIREEFLKWNRAGGKVLAGLTKRRAAEADLYFS